MAELYPSQHLPDKLPGSVLAETPVASLQLLKDRVVHVLEDQVQLATAAEDLNQVDQVLMAKALKKMRDSVKTIGGNLF